MKIKFGNTLEEISENSCITVGDLRNETRKLFDLHSKVTLIFRGKLLTEDSVNLKDLSFENESLVTVISGSSLEKLEKLPRVKDDLTNSNVKDGNKISLSDLNNLNFSKELSKIKYKFNSIETITNMEHESLARGILNGLSRDKGILHVMNKYKFSVGSLCEMYPEGYVGVSDVCVMGLNQNKGEKILLRLRTDDLKGFRPILSIRKVLYHELSHNIHSNHDDDFYILMRQIEKDVNEYYDKNGGPEYIETNVNSVMVATPVRTVRTTGGVKAKGVPAQVMAGLSAIRRSLSEEEVGIEKACGCCSDTRNEVLINNNNENDTAAETDSIICIPCEEDSSVRLVNTPSSSSQLNPEVSANLTSDVIVEASTIMDVESLHTFDEYIEKIECRLSEFISNSAAMCSDGVIERVVRAGELIMRLVRWPSHSNSVESVKESLEALVKILRNVMSNPKDPKYGRIKYSSQYLNKQVLRHNGLEILLIGCFDTIKTPNSTEIEYLSSRASLDIGWLYLLTSLLESLLEIV